jgi:hypothetical protein
MSYGVRGGMSSFPCQFLLDMCSCMEQNTSKVHVAGMRVRIRLSLCVFELTADDRSSRMSRYGSVNCFGCPTRR